MLSAIGKGLLRIWRGAWAPTFVRPQERRWWHEIHYWGVRTQDYIGAVYIFVGPLWIGFMIYEKFASKPKPVLALTAIMGTIWIVLVALAYHRGREPIK